MRRAHGADDGLPGPRRSRCHFRTASAGTRLDLLTAITTGRLDEAEAMLRENPDRIGPDGADTIALCLAVSKKIFPRCAGCSRMASPSTPGG